MLDEVKLHSLLGGVIASIVVLSSWAICARRGRGGRDSDLLIRDFPRDAHCWGSRPQQPHPDRAIVYAVGYRHMMTPIVVPRNI